MLRKKFGVRKVSRFKIFGLEKFWGLKKGVRKILGFQKKWVSPYKDVLGFQKNGYLRIKMFSNLGVKIILGLEKF